MGTSVGTRHAGRFARYFAAGFFCSPIVEQKKDAAPFTFSSADDFLPYNDQTPIKVKHWRLDSILQTPDMTADPLNRIVQTFVIFTRQSRLPAIVKRAEQNAQITYPSQKKAAAADRHAGYQHYS